MSSASRRLFAAVRKGRFCKLLARFFAPWMSFVVVWPACAGSNELSIADLLARSAEQSRFIDSFQVEALVCAVVPDRNLLVLQDDSASVLVEVPEVSASLRAGDWVSLKCNQCAVTRNRFGLQLASAPVVNNDGHHPAISKFGKVSLEAGMQPVRVSWFNGRGAYALNVEYEGPGIPRQTIPGNVLFRKPEPAASSAFEQGLDFDAYIGNFADDVPDFRCLRPISHGIATNGFDTRYSVRPENTALIFNGFIKIAASGRYTFWVTSDDGAYLYAGDPAACRLTVLRRMTSPVPEAFQNALISGRDHVWTELEGQVTFLSESQNGVELNVMGKGEAVRAEIVGGAELISSNLLHRVVRLAGILEDMPDNSTGQQARLVVPGPSQMKLDLVEQDSESKPGTNALLTTAKQIRRLIPAEARRGLPAKIRGVVTWRSSMALVLQDATDGVYIRYIADDWTAQPSVGEIWELEGVTDPGDFSPVLFARKAKFLGYGASPEPLRPTWDQILNGGLDAEYVELRGALTEVSSTQMTLLTSDGKIRIWMRDDHPLPYLAPLPDGESYIDSIVRIRGCFTADWNSETKRVIGGEIALSPGTVQVEEFAPKDPFGIAAKKVSDLLLFDPNPNELRRARVQGQAVLSAHGLHFLQDGAAGLRLRTKKPLTIQPGERVEAVGFLQYGGPSPVLQEAEVRKIGKAPLPPPVPIAAAELRNISHDSTRVQTEALLINDSIEGGVRVLEMQVGQNHFIARLKQSEPGWKPLAAGARVKLTGVYVSENNERAGGNLDAFELWLNSPADVEIVQRPPWWTLRRALAIVGALAGVLGLAAIWIALLQRRVKERTIQLKREIEERQLVEQRRLMEQERTRVAQDLHDELGAGLTEVGLLGDLVKNPIVPGLEKEHYLGQLTEIARTLVTSLDAIVWAINPRYDSAASLASYYTLFAQRFLNLAGVACRPEIPADFPECPLDPKARHGLFLAFKEALNNVVRHAEATEVHLKIEVCEDELIIIIADNGSGFQLAPDLSESEGLSGMRRRMEQLGGGCEISSRPGKGTEVKLRLPTENLVYD